MFFCVSVVSVSMPYMRGTISWAQGLPPAFCISSMMFFITFSRAPLEHLQSHTKCACVSSASLHSMHFLLSVIFTSCSLDVVHFVSHMSEHDIRMSFIVVCLLVWSIVFHATSSDLTPHNSGLCRALFFASVTRSCSVSMAVMFPFSLSPFTHISVQFFISMIVLVFPVTYASSAILSTIWFALSSSVFGLFSLSACAFTHFISTCFL